MTKDWRTLKLEVLAETKDFIKGMDKANAATKTFGDKMADFAKKAAVALAAVAAAAGAMAIKIGKEAVAAASDLAETTSKVNVIFGQAAKTIETFGSSAAQSLGQTRTQAMNAAATFGVFGKSAGLAGEDLANFSTEFVTLASDLASFNNTSVDQAITALGAALRGESEPIRAYGVLLNDATLKAQAMKMGIYDGSGALTAQQKVLAAHQVILNQTRDAQGDFERTSNGLANQQRILTARLEEAKIVLGTALLPVVLEVLRVFNERFLPIIEKIAGSFGGKEGLVEQVKAFSRELKENLGPILDAIRDSFDKVTQALKDNEDNLKDVYELFQTLWQFFNTFFVPILKSQVINAIEGIGTAFSAIIKIITPVIGFIADRINDLVRLIDAVIGRINNLITAYNRISLFADVPTIGTGGGTFGGTLGLPGGLGALGGGAGGGGGGGLGGGGGAGGGGVDLAKLSKGLVTSPSDLIDKLTATSGRISDIQFALDTGQINKARAAQLLKPIQTEFNQLQRVAEAFANIQPITNRASAEDVRLGNAITINVNAPSVIDETGFTRAVVDAMNSVERRQAGGYSALFK
jgi:hypothetical protein